MFTYLGLIQNPLVSLLISNIILDHLDDRGRCKPQAPSDSWDSASLIPHPYTYSLPIFSTAFAICVTAVVIFVICRHFKLLAWVASLALAPLQKAEANPLPTHTVVCSNPHLTVLATVITTICLLLWLYVHCKHFTWLRGYHYNRTCTLYIFLFNTHLYVLFKIKWLSGHMHMYKLSNAITPDGLSVQKSFLWDIIHFDWQYMHLHMNSQPVTLPTTVIIPLKDHIRAHHMLAKEDIDLQFMIKTGL